MPHKQFVSERELTALAKHFRKEAGKNRAQAGRDMGVSHVSIYRAEEYPDESLVRLRVKMIEAYSSLKVKGPLFVLEEGQASKRNRLHLRRK